MGVSRGTNHICYLTRSEWFWNATLDVSSRRKSMSSEENTYSIGRARRHSNRSPSSNKLNLMCKPFPVCIPSFSQLPLPFPPLPLFSSLPRLRLLLIELLCTANPTLIRRHYGVLAALFFAPFSSLSTSTIALVCLALPISPA